MTWADIERDWAQLKGLAKQRWTKLGEEQLGAIGGRRKSLAARVRETYNLSQEETERQLADWQSGLKSREPLK